MREYRIEDGYIYRNLGEGIEYNIHMPENVTPNTPVIIYAYGSGGADSSWQDAAKLALNENAICIFPVSQADIDYSMHWGEVIDKVLDDAKTNYNIPTSNIIPAGHSAGGPVTLIGLSNYIENNNIKEPQVAVTLDGYYGTCSVPPEEVEVLKENNTVVFAFCHPGYQSYNYKTMASQGLNMVIIEELDSRYDFGTNHALEYKNFFDSNGRIEYVNGTGKLLDSTNGYRITIYKDGECVYTNAENPHDISAIDTRNKVFEYLGINTLEIKLKTLQELNSFSLTNLSFSINDGELASSLSQVISKIGSTTFVNGGFDLSSSIGLQTVTKISELATDYFVTTTNLLFHIANEMQEYTKIGSLLSSAEKEIIENNNNELSEAVTLSETIINENQATVEQDNKEIVPATPSVPKTDEPNNSQEEKEEPKKETEEKTEIIEEQDDNKTQQENTQPIVNDKPKEEQKQPDVQNKPTTNSKPHNTNTPSDGNNNTNKTNPLEQFPEYKEVYSDENKIVYDYNNEYRIIVHKEGNEIIGIEHYYKFDSETAATNALNSLKLEYSNNANMENIVQKGQYVKVIFKEEMYENLTIPEIRKQYSQLSEIIKL